MRFYPDQTYHIFNRGNNRQKIFYRESNYHYFTRKLKSHLCPISDILAYCLMPNHFHIIIHSTESSCTTKTGNHETGIQSLSFQIGKMISSYTMGINKQEGRTGSLFQSKTKSKALTLDKTDDNYLITAFNYVHQNPIKARLVQKMEDWPYSSFNEYNIDSRNGICNKDLFYSLSGWERDTFYEDSYAVIKD